MLEYALLFVVLWALGLVSYLIIRADNNSQRYLDCIMSLTNKEAAAISTSIGRARKTPIPTQKDLAEKTNGRKVDAAHIAIIDRIEQSGVITADDEKALEAIANGRHGI